VCATTSLCKGYSRSAGGQRCRKAARSFCPHALQAPSAEGDVLQKPLHSSLSRSPTTPGSKEGQGTCQSSLPLAFVHEMEPARVSF
jgi:hypothetical protein